MLDFINWFIFSQSNLFPNYCICHHNLSFLKIVINNISNTLEIMFWLNFREEAAHEASIVSRDKVQEEKSLLEKVL